VAVVISATHECISSRGIGMHGVAMVTRRLTGQFEREPWRRDILDALAI
jgi:GTP cyclohydrolase I